MHNKLKASAALATLAALGLAAVSPASAQAVNPNNVIAYYTFDGGTAGAKVPTTPDANAPSGSPVIDDSGHGNNLKTYDATTGPVYSTNTETSTGLSAQYTPNEDTYALNAVGGGATGTTLDDHVFTNFTVEASVHFNDLGGEVGGPSPWQSFVVKDNPGVVNGGADAPFLLRKWGDQNNMTNELNVNIMDSTGTVHPFFTNGTNPGGTTTPFAFTANTWYNIAVVGDGTNASVYVQQAGAGQYTFEGSIADPGGINGMNSNWDVGRGWNANGPADFVDANVDSVRISDVALDPSQFLFATPAPEPTQYAALGIGILGLGLLGLKARRRVSA